MAAPVVTQRFLTTTTREDLTDVVASIDPINTWCLSNFGRTKATQTLHEWSIESLAAAAANAQIEGVSATFAQSANDFNTRVGNYTQISSKTVRVSSTLEAATVAGRPGGSLAAITARKMKELSRDIEYALVINSTTASGASGTARQLCGVIGWITGNNTTGTGTGNEALTESMYNDNLQAIWADGGVGPFTTLCGAFQKRKFDAFTTNTRYAMADENKLSSAVNVYESSFGVCVIRLHHQINTSAAGTLVTLGDMDLWKTAWLRPVQKKQIADIGDTAGSFLIVGEYTLEARNQNGSGKITGLTTS